MHNYQNDPRIPRIREVHPLIPSYILPDILMKIDGIECGGHFVNAVFDGDFVEAACRADGANQKALGQIILLVYRDKSLHLSPEERIAKYGEPWEKEE